MSSTQKVVSTCRAEIDRVYEMLCETVCQSDKERSELFSNFQMKIVDGVWFRPSEKEPSLTFALTQSILDSIGVELASFPELSELSFKAFSKFCNNSEEIPNKSEFLEVWSEEFEALMSNKYDLIAPCELFEFSEDATSLASNPISVLPADEVLDQLETPRSGKNWELVVGQKFGYSTGEVLTQSISGQCWLIRTQTTNKNARQKAQWTASAFMSLVRLGITPTDYCHRPGVGQIEARPLDKWIMEHKQLTVSASGWAGGSSEAIRRYKISKRFSDDFHAPEFQAKIESVFFSKKKSVGARVMNGLVWLTKGRHAPDHSERLLCFFTAIEALLSEQSAFVPVSDSIARYVSIILGSKPETRSNIYKEIKKLYGLRSSLVHRGERGAHLLNANNIQHVAETCYAIVLQDVDLNSSHSEFLASLKSATHGHDWPIKA